MSPDLSVLFIMLLFIALLAIGYSSSPNPKKYVLEKYDSLNINDRLKITLNIYDADPWSFTYTTYATITDKKNGWLKIKYDDGSGDTIEFALHNIDTINTLEKI